MASLRPSNHESTAAKLGQTGIRYKVVKLEGPLDFSSEWERFAKLCGSKVDSKSAWLKLQNSITDTYRGELEFDRKLYQDIMGLLGTCVQSMGDHLYLLSNNKSIGIARQVQRQRHLGFCDDYGLTTSAIQDHAVVLVNVNGSILNETSLVELKTDDSNCCTFPITNNMARRPNLSKDHGALGQALIYTAGDLLNCLARCGIVENCLEILVLSGKKQNRKHAQQRLCYVRGSLNIPEYCGKPFSYSVLDFESYNNHDAEKHGLAAYFNTLSNGIERAIRRGKNPTPLCGRRPRIANCTIPTASLVGSPIPGVNLEYKVSQGEIFRTSLSSVLHAYGPEMLWMLDNTEVLLQQIQQGMTPEVTVLVKFGCQSVHNYFVPPSQSYVAIQRLHSNRTTKKALSNVLLGVWSIDSHGSVTITKELKDCEPTKPKEVPRGEMPNLWCAFVKFAEDLLIPMANMGVVHADLRPGWTETANILLKRLPDGTYMLRLIDYEGLCRIEAIPVDCNTLDDDDGDESNKALRHLWWQCLYTAYTWAMHLDYAKDIFDLTVFVGLFQNEQIDNQFWGEVDSNDVVSIEKQEAISGEMVLATLRILCRIPGLTI